MTVKQLIELLKTIPAEQQEFAVLMDGCCNSCWQAVAGVHVYGKEEQVVINNETNLD